MKNYLFSIIVALIITGCATQQTVSPVIQIEGKQVCVIENPKVRQGFLKAFKQALVDKGYEVRVLEPSSSVDACPITATYTANWWWGGVMAGYHMAYAAIRVYSNGKTAGEVIYDVQDVEASMRMYIHTEGKIRDIEVSTRKYINAEENVRELVKQLFPNRTGS